MFKKVENVPGTVFVRPGRPRLRQCTRRRVGVRYASVERSGGDGKAHAPSLSRAVARAEYQTFVALRRIAAKSAGFSRQVAKAGTVRFHFDISITLHRRRIFGIVAKFD